MDKANADKKALQDKSAQAAVAATNGASQAIIAAEEGQVNILPIGAGAALKKEGYHVTKNIDGTF